MVWVQFPSYAMVDERVLRLYYFAANYPRQIRHSIYRHAIAVKRTSGIRNLDNIGLLRGKGLIRHMRTIIKTENKYISHRHYVS